VLYGWLLLFLLLGAGCNNLYRSTNHRGASSVPTASQHWSESASQDLSTSAAEHIKANSEERSGTDVIQLQITELREQLKQLARERDELQTANADLRQKLEADVLQAGPSGGTQNSGGIQPAIQLTHWITLKSQKRHNNKCAHYRKTMGRDCSAEEGIPCRLCGG
jgi:FtsZ-binding cell division protein ZapB